MSSSSADQLNSYTRQIETYTRIINANNEWVLVDIFADEGISGTKADNRPEFQRLIRLCELRQVDLILTKSISRFARNTKEALSYARRLKRLGVGIKFEKEGMLDQLRSKGYLATDIHQSQVNDLQKQLKQLKEERQSQFESRILEMLEQVRKLQHLIEEIEEPLEDFDEHLFGEIVTDITINNRDEMTVTVLGGLKFTEQI